MKVTYIASEYNPFHNGHRYMIEKLKQSGSDAVVAVMSGNFVQRGEPALCEKHIRAKAALLGGADLVLELPVRYALANAKYFAEGFVKTVSACGIKSDFAFGTTSSYKNLCLLSEIIFSPEAEAFCRDKSENEGLTYPAALTQFTEINAGKEMSHICSEPNNILALEYIRAINKYIPEAGIECVERKGTAHDSKTVNGEFASAGFIRNEIYSLHKSSSGLYNLYNIKKYIPATTLETLNSALSEGLLPCDKIKFETAVLSRLFMKDALYFTSINNVSQGLENRIYEALKISPDLDSLYENIKTKRYTLARIRQIIINSALEIKRDDLLRDISYIRVLGADKTGRKILKQIKDKCRIPVYSNLSEADKTIEGINRDVLLDYNAGKFFNLCLPAPEKGNPEYDIPPVFI